MFKLLIVLALCSFTAYSATYSYDIATATATDNTKVAKVALTLDTTVTNTRNYMKWSLKYTTGGTATLAPNVSSGDEDAIVCCVSAVAASTDPIANEYSGRCWAGQLAIAASNSYKAWVGIKSGSSFFSAAVMAEVAAAGITVGSSSNDYSLSFELQKGIHRATGFDPTTASGLTVNCVYTQNAASGPADTAIASPSGWPIPSTSATVTSKDTTITAAGTTICKATTSPSSGSFAESVISLGVLGTVSALLALY